ncbi:MAG: ABC transporter ATP-binding protein [Clostridia bacterium]|nr:ABC transporter ATP-binding protein [Clostridia bacterium]
MIEVKNVSKKYGKFYAVRDISFTIKDGEIVGFLGRNGAGKSTTMNMITGFIEPTEGTIIVNGYDVDRKPKKVKESIGYMPEGTPLYYDLTVKEFVTYMAELKLIPRKERKAAVQKAITETGLEKVQNKLTKNLSRGYKQRVSLAGAIVGDPKILILDEPTVGLDPAQVIEIRELIKSFRKDHTVILSSHILSEVSQICEKVIIIDKGEVVAVDTPQNLEKSTTEKTILRLTVEDENDKFETIKDSISSIKNITFAGTNDDKSKEYVIETDENADIRKEMFSKCAELGVVILEMKKDNASLEDAFIKLVEDRPEYSEKEIEKMEYQKELEDLRKELEDKKEEKAFKKQAKKEEKARKKAQKEDKKASKEAAKKEKGGDK